MSNPDRKFKNAGARAERACWMAHLRRMPQSPNVEALIEWGLKRKDRYEKRSGGLGRKG